MYSIHLVLAESAISNTGSIQWISMPKLILYSWTSSSFDVCSCFIIWERVWYGNSDSEKDCHSNVASSSYQWKYDRILDIWIQYLPLSTLCTSFTKRVVRHVSNRSLRKVFRWGHLLHVDDVCPLIPMSTNIVSHVSSTILHLILFYYTEVTEYPGLFVFCLLWTLLTTSELLRLAEYSSAVGSSFRS